MEYYIYLRKTHIKVFYLNYRIIFIYFNYFFCLDDLYNLKKKIHVRYKFMYVINIIKLKKSLYS